MRFKLNRLVIIPWRNTILFQEFIGDHFGVKVKRNGDHFRVGIILGSIWGSFQGWGSFRGRDHFGGCTYTLFYKHASYFSVTAGVQDYRITYFTHLDLSIWHNRTLLWDCGSRFSSERFSGEGILQSFHFLLWRWQESKPSSFCHHQSAHILSTFEKKWPKSPNFASFFKKILNHLSTEGGRKAENRCIEYRSLKHQLANCLFQYRNTLHSVRGVTLTELF